MLRVLDYIVLNCLKFIASKVYKELSLGQLFFQFSKETLSGWDEPKIMGTFNVLNGKKQFVFNTREGKDIRKKKIFKSHQQGSPIGATRLKRDEEYLCHWLHEHMTYSAQLLTYSFEMCILPITIISEKEINTISKVKEGRKNCQSKKRKRSKG